MVIQLSDQELLNEFDRSGFITCSPSMMPLLRRAHKTAESCSRLPLATVDLNQNNLAALLASMRH